MAERKKSIAKSVRMTEEVFGYIDAFPGNGFNEKFERLVMETQSSRPGLPQELAYIEDQIKSRGSDLNELWNEELMIVDLVNDLNVVRDKINSLKAYIDSIVEFGSSQESRMPLTDESPRVALIPSKAPLDDY